MSLNEYYEKKVRIVSDNEPEEESIAIRCENGPLIGKSVEFPEHDIVSIQIIS